MSIVWHPEFGHPPCYVGRRSYYILHPIFSIFCPYMRCNKKKKKGRVKYLDQTSFSLFLSLSPPPPSHSPWMLSFSSFTLKQGEKRASGSFFPNQYGSFTRLSCSKPGISGGSASKDPVALVRTQTCTRQ